MYRLLTILAGLYSKKNVDDMLFRKKYFRHDKDIYNQGT